MRPCARNGCARVASWFGRGSGVTVDGRWYCSVACVERLARSRVLEARPASGGLPSPGHLRLGVWLRSFGVTTKQVDEALAAQRSTGMRLGAQLIALGHATSEMVLEALARQSGADFVPHVDPAVVRHAPGGLSPHAVRALSLVPITRPEGGRIRVACAAPVPRVALAAFSRITSLVPEPCVVTDAVYEALVDAYGADATRQETAEFVSTEDLGEAVRHIAAAALGDRSSQLTETRLAPLTWVRVRGEHGVHDVVLNEQLKEA